MTNGIERRILIATFAAAGAASIFTPLFARAQSQQQSGMRHIGILMNGLETDATMRKYLGAFEQAFAALGWIERQNVSIERRWTGGNPELTRRYAPELVALSPDLILSLSSANLAALQQATQSIPIVFALVSDPVAQGFVPNLTRPSGNITGFSAYEASVGGKWVDLLRQLSPGLKRVALMFNPEVSIQSKYFFSSIEPAARVLGVEAIAVPIRSPEQIIAAVTNLAQHSNSGVIIPTDQFMTVNRRILIDLLARHRLPAIYAQHEFIPDGGLISYSTDQAEQLRKAAVYVDRILKGTAPGTLPIQNPVKFKCVINLKTARALGIEIPLGIMLAADEVVE